MPIIVIAIILSVFAVLAWRDFKLALTVIVALAPAYLLRFTLGIPWTVLEGMILIAFLLWAVRQAQALSASSKSTISPPLKDSPTTYISSLQWSFVLLLIAATAAITWAPKLSDALGIWKAYFLEPTLMFVMLRSAFTDRADWTRTLTALAITTIAVSALAIFQKLSGLGIPVPWDTNRRVTSIFEYPNALGLWVAPIVSAILVFTTTQLQLLVKESKVQGIAHLIAIFFGITAIVLAQTEAALVAIPIAVGVAVTLWLSKSKTPQTGAFAIVLFMTIIIGTVACTAIPVIREKLWLQDYSGQVRRAQWAETINMLKDKPLQGAGLAGYPRVFASYHDPRLYEIFQYPHNVILNFWSEMGIFGVIAFLWVVIIVCKLAWHHRNDPFVLTAFAALLTMTIHGLVDVPFFKNDLAILTAFFLALLISQPVQSLEHSKLVIIKE